MSTYIIDNLTDLRKSMNGIEEFLRKRYRNASNKPFLVGRGKSGAIIIPTIALNLDFPFVLLRKSEENHHDSGHILVAAQHNDRQKYVIVDDFCDTGQTIKVIKEEINKYQPKLKLDCVLFYKMLAYSRRMKNAQKAAGSGIKIYPFEYGVLNKKVVQYIG